MTRRSHASRRERSRTNRRRFVKAIGGAGVAGLAGYPGGEPAVTATASEVGDSSDEDGGGNEPPTDTITLGGSMSLSGDLADKAGIDYLLGPYSSGITLPASDVAANAERPMVAGGAASNQIFERDNEWIVSLLPTMVVYQWQPEAGRQLVWPEQVSEAAPIYPMPTRDER